MMYALVQKIVVAFIVGVGALPVSAILTLILVKSIGKESVGTIVSHWSQLFNALGLQGEPIEISLGWISILVILFGVPYDCVVLGCYFALKWSQGVESTLGFVNRCVLLATPAICLPLPIVIVLLRLLFTHLVRTENERFLPTITELEWSRAYFSQSLPMLGVTGLPLMVMSFGIIYLAASWDVSKGRAGSIHRGTQHQ